MTLPTLGKYEIIERLGSGATADVYRARDTVLGRNVALKVLKPALVPDASAFNRFIQEAQAAARLFHPRIATVLDMGDADGRYFIAMRYIPGRSLDHILKEDGPLPWPEALRLAQDIGSALDYAHAEGFLHRDVKPSNIIRDEKGNFWLTDFGLTRAMMSTGLTSHTGALMGTPPYIPPEIWEGQPALPASDQYALACVVYEALTGEMLFRGETPPAIMTAHMLKGAHMPEQWPQGVPAGLSAMLGKALHKEPAERWASASEFAQALEGLTQVEVNARREAAEQAHLQAQAEERRKADEAAAREKARQEAEAMAQRDAAEAKARHEAEVQAVQEKGEQGLTLPPQTAMTPIHNAPLPPWWKTGWVYAIIGSVATVTLCAIAIGLIGLVKGPEIVSLLPPYSTSTLTPSPSRTTAPTKTPEPTATPTTSPTPSPTPPPLNGKIIFLSDRNSEDSIYVVNSDGLSQPRRISSSGFDYWPSWSASENQILFMSRRNDRWEFYTVNPTGNQELPIATSDYGRPILSPIGDKLAWLQWNNLNIYDFETSEMTILNLDDWFDVFTWSPDGKKIAALKTYREDDQTWVEIQILDINASYLTAETILKLVGTYDSDTIDWSPDGTWLAFPLSPGDSGELGIYKIRPNGTDFSLLADVMGAEDTNPVWSPDSSHLLFVSTSDTRGDSSSSTEITACDNSVIYRVSISGNDLLALTEDNVESYDPVWSPDGKRIAYVVLEGQNNEIYIMGSDGDNQLRITDPTDNADEYHPSWSPDGLQIVFASSKYAPRLYLLDPITRLVTLIANDFPLVVHSSPQITWGGNFLAFTRELSFSSKHKTWDGTNTAICSFEELVFITNPRQYEGNQIPDTSTTPATRTIWALSDDGRWVLYNKWSSSTPMLWDRQNDEFIELEGVPDTASAFTLSPDGQQVAYYDYDTDQVYLMTVTTGQTTLLSAGTEAYGYDMKFSPHGTYIMFETRDDTLQIRNLQGTLVNEIPIQSDEYLEEYIWMPDEMHVVYETWIGGQGSTLWLYDLNQNHSRQITSIDADVYALTASPDGLWLAFESRISRENDEIYAIPVDGGEIINLSNHLADDETPIWIP